MRVPCGAGNPLFTGDFLAEVRAAMVRGAQDVIKGHTGAPADEDVALALVLSMANAMNRVEEATAKGKDALESAQRRAGNDLGAKSEWGGYASRSCNVRREHQRPHPSSPIADPTPLAVPQTASPLLSVVPPHAFYGASTPLTIQGAQVPPPLAPQNLPPMPAAAASPITSPKFVLFPSPNQAQHAPALASAAPTPITKDAENPLEAFLPAGHPDNGPVCWNWKTKWG
eukprot:TRINITY_DN17011_c0_g1_i1.p1 TRINITY_DN17011_c0_g1~~TRINITY_DN17011_c0_g1_i1.p1  ORF type:complete len:228 (-),score=33.77 TRINITY_DN17011_c0_g1_i1:264-947(-)